MSKVLVAYFSAGGVTEKVAKELAAVEKADLFEIVPEPRYTAADLDWRNQSVRCSICRLPDLVGKRAERCGHIPGRL